MNTFKVMKDSFDNRPSDEEIKSKLNDKVTDEQYDKFKSVMQSMEFTEDSLSFTVDSLGKITLKIIDREENKCVKYQAVDFMLPITLWIQTLPTSATTSKMKVTLETELNMFFRTMIGKKLEKGIDNFAEVIAKLPY
jgi:hypothetical protein